MNMTDEVTKYSFFYTSWLMTFTGGIIHYYYAGRLNQHVLALTHANHRKNSKRDAGTPKPEEILFNTMTYKSSETVQRLGYFQSSALI